VYDAALAGTAGHGREGYYFSGNGEYSWYELSKAVAEAFVALGKSDKAEPTVFTQEEREKIRFVSLSGDDMNLRC